MTNEDKINVLKRAIADRMKAIKVLREKINGWEGEIIEMEEELNELQAEALSVDAEPVKHGRWIEDDEGFCHCSVCKELSDWEHRYCPNCGAKMDLKTNDKNTEKWRHFEGTT